MHDWGDSGAPRFVKAIESIVLCCRGIELLLFCIQYVNKIKNEFFQYMYLWCCIVAWLLIIIIIIIFIGHTDQREGCLCWAWDEWCRIGYMETWTFHQR